MQLQQQRADVETISQGEQTSYQFGLDMSNVGLLLKQFSDGLYSNKIGSIVREIASNSWDANQEAGSRIPVKITIVDPDPIMGDSGSIIFEDHGPGLSPDRVDNVFTKYFASTKRDNNNQIGGFGIGAKSPLAYTDSFLVETVYGSSEYSYVISKTAENIPTMVLMETKATVKSSGTRIIIPVKNKDDANRFREEIAHQLKYFDNIDYENCNQSNEYQLVRGKHFIARMQENLHDSTVDLCIGKVAYPLDRYQCGLDFEELEGSFGILFDVGELSVTLNREGIEYTPANIEKIKDRYYEATAELSELWTKSMAEIKDLPVFYQALKEHLLRITASDQTIKGKIKLPKRLTRDIEFSTFQHLPCKVVIDEHLFYQYRLVARITNGKLCKNTGRRFFYGENSSVGFSMFSSNIPVFRARDTSPNLTTRKAAYIRSLYPAYTAIISKKANPQIDKEYIISSRNAFAPVLQDVETTRRYVDTYIQNFIIDHTTSYEDFQIPADWGKAARIQTEHPEGSITYKRAQRYVNGAFKICSETDEQIRDQTLPGSLILYGFSPDDEKLHKIWTLFSLTQYGRSLLEGRSDKYPDCPYVHILKISKANEKYFQSLGNAVHVADFPNARPKLFQRLVYLGKHHAQFESLYHLTNTFSCGMLRVSELFTDVRRLNGKVQYNPPEDRNMVTWIEEYPDEQLSCTFAGKDYAAVMTRLQTWVDTNPLLQYLKAGAPLPAVCDYLRKTSKSLLNYE